MNNDLCFLLSAWKGDLQNSSVDDHCLDMHHELGFLCAWGGDLKDSSVHDHSLDMNNDLAFLCAWDARELASPRVLEVEDLCLLKI